MTIFSRAEFVEQIKILDPRLSMFYIGVANRRSVVPIDIAFNDGTIPDSYHKTFEDAVNNLLPVAYTVRVSWLNIQKELDSAEIETIGHMFLEGPVWDGALISKDARSTLVAHKIVDRIDGFNFLTPFGVVIASKIALHGWEGNAFKTKWIRKQSYL